MPRMIKMTYPIFRPVSILSMTAAAEGRSAKADRIGRDTIMLSAKSWRALVRRPVLHRSVSEEDLHPERASLPASDMNMPVSHIAMSVASDAAALHKQG